MSGPFKHNRCDSCGRFRPWEDLIQHFVPDTSFSSEDDSWQECADCADDRPDAALQPTTVLASVPHEHDSEGRY